MLMEVMRTGEFHALAAHRGPESLRDPAARNPRCGCDRAQRMQHEGAFVHARMRHREPGNRDPARAV